MEPTQRTDQMVQQILKRMRERVAAQAAPVIPVQQPQPMPSYAPQPAYQQPAAPAMQPFPAAPQPGPDVLAAMQSMPLFPAQNAAPAAPPPNEYAWAQQFVPGGVPDYARDYYAEMIAKGRGNEGTDGYYNDSGSTAYNHMYSPDWQ